MAEPDVLGGGPAPGGRRFRPPRRLTAGAGIALATLAAVVAVRSGPGPAEVAPTPTPAPPAPAVLDPGPPIVDLAVGARAAYALVGLCEGPEQARTCSYRLLRKSAGGGDWTSHRLPDGALALAGFTARLFVTGDDVVTVVDTPGGTQAVVSRDGGTTFTARRLRPGPPIPAVPADGVLDLGLCPDCAQRLTVLEPGTGLLRPLATQPPLGRGPVRAFAAGDGVLWAAGRAAATAVSTDGGRSWRPRPVPGLRLPADDVRLAATAAGAYLVVSRDQRPDVEDEFTELWQAAGPTGTWRPATPDQRPRSVLSLLAGRRGLLVSDAAGVLWRRAPDGSLHRLPDAVVDGRRHGPGWVVTGPSGLLAAVPLDGPAPGQVLVSFDEGETWQAGRLPG